MRERGHALQHGGGGQDAGGDSLQRDAVEGEAEPIALEPPEGEQKSETNQRQMNRKRDG